MTQPVRLSRTPYEKVWGSPLTEPWYRNPTARNIGEIWFGASADFPLLVKLLFTSDKLSVQVHPDDTYAAKHHASRGKTEMWHILRADPGARVALGLNQHLGPEALRHAAESGEIMDALNWLPATPGDTFFIPAGTIHAIGEGLVICEVQQLSDITYRLYDYGRPRELHLDHAVAVSRNDCGGGPAPLPLECRYFHTDRLEIHGALECPPPAHNTLYIALAGEGRFAGEPFTAGEAFEVSPDSLALRIESTQAAFLVTSAP